MTDIKLAKNEVIHAKTFDLACKLCEQFNKLGLKWSDGDSYLRNIRWDYYDIKTCYDINHNILADTNFFSNKKLVSAIEWLNRHDIFVVGQKVQVRGHSDGIWVKRIYLAPHVCVMDIDEKNYWNKSAFRICQWEYMRSIYAPYIDNKVEITIDGKSFLISRESADTLMGLGD